jgi:hypothetical protein
MLDECRGQAAPQARLISDKSVSLCFGRYDVELFQKIEALTGLKMELYPTDQARLLCPCCGV